MDLAIQTSKSPAIDEDGLLLEPNQWDESIAVELAHQRGINELKPDH